MDLYDKGYMETNITDQNAIKKNLINLSSLIGKALIIDYILNIIFMVLVSLILDAFKKLGISFNYESISSMSDYSITFISEILVFLWLIKKAKINNINFSYKKDRIGKGIWRYVIFLFSAQLLGTICYMLIQLISAPFGIKWGGSELELPINSAFDSIIYSIFVCLAAPVGEELFFRGAVLKSLQLYGSKFAIIISAVLFGLVHGNFEQIPFAFFAGLIFGYIAVKTDSLFYPIIFHIINNSWAVVHELLYRYVPNVFMNVVLITIMLIGAAGLIIAFQDRKELINSIDLIEADCIECSYNSIHKYFFKSFWIWCALIIMFIFCITSMMQ